MNINYVFLYKTFLNKKTQISEDFLSLLILLVELIPVDETSAVFAGSILLLLLFFCKKKLKE